MKRTKLKRKYNELSNPGKNTNQDNNTQKERETKKYKYQQKCETIEYIK